MVKIICFVLASLASVALIGAQRCDTGDDCKEGKCCVTKIPGMFWIPMGYCQRRLKEGEECMPDFLHNMAGEGKYFVKCPCKEGLECEKKHKYSQKHSCINPDPPSTTQPTTERVEMTTTEGMVKETTVVTDEGLIANSTQV